MKSHRARLRREVKAEPRAVSTRVGLYFGFLQFFFTLSWVIYVIYLPKLAAQTGIARAVVPWILVLDEAIFAMCDWATGIATDRVASILGRLGKIVAGVTALSALAFLLLPLATKVGPAVFLALVIIWAITSAALRAPPLTLLGRYTPTDQQPWVGSLFLLGVGVATGLSPVLGSRITAYDPRILFAASAVAVVVVTFAILWAEKTLVHSAPADTRSASQLAPSRTGQTKSGTFLVFLAGVLLVALAFQMHSFINAEPLFTKFARHSDLPGLLSLFWIGFSLLMLPASFLTERFGGIAVMSLGALVAAVSSLAASAATGLVWLSVAQFICGGAWGCAAMSAVAAAFAIGHPGNEGKAVGAMLSLIAVAAIARLVLVAVHFEQIHALAAAMPWLPALSWLAGGLILLPAARRRARPK